MKYTRLPIKEFFPFISHKYGIKPHSVQRQLRYVCTLNENKNIKPIHLVSLAWYEIKREEK